MITMAAGADQPPSRLGYRAHKDDIGPIASASAMPVHHSRSQSPLRKSTSKPKRPTSRVFPRLPERTSRTHSRLFVASTSRSAALKLLSDVDEVCATWCLKIGRYTKARPAAKSSSLYQNSARRHHEPSFIALQVLPARRRDDRRSFVCPLVIIARMPRIPAKPIQRRTPCSYGAQRADFLAVRLRG